MKPIVCSAALVAALLFGSPALAQGNAEPEQPSDAEPSDQPKPQAKPNAANQPPNGGEDQPKNAAGAPAPAKPESEADAPKAVLDAALRTFAGPCLVRPLGGEQQAALAGLASALIPKFIGTGIDLLTSALEAAGRDKVTIITAVLPLEHRPECIQIARDPVIDTSELVGKSSSEVERLVREGLWNAPFLVELYLRQSRDGSAVAVMPTVIRYAQSLDGTRTGRRPRELFATISFVPFGSTEASKVSVPLGKRAPRSGSGHHFFDPVRSRPATLTAFPTGAAASPWVKTPFVSPESPAAANAVAVVTRVSAPNRASGGTGSGGFGQTVIPGATQPAPPAADEDSEDPGKGNGKGDNPKPKPKPPVALNGSSAPLTISIDLRETEQGSAFARTLASLLKGSREPIVNAFDPAKQAELKKTETENWKTTQSGYATALADFYKKRAVFCASATDDAGLAGREAAAADVLESQIKLVAAARLADESDVPFTSMIQPGAPSFTQDCG